MLTDFQKSRYLFGIVDELDRLNNNEVFIYISDVGLIEGNVLVTR